LSRAPLNKQVGADEKLSSVIDGESLVNDGSALVIFLVLQQFVQGATLSPVQVRVCSRVPAPSTAAGRHPATKPSTRRSDALPPFCPPLPLSCSLPAATDPQITALFVRLALGGAAIGFGFCLVTSLWLAAIFKVCVGWVWVLGGVQGVGCCLRI
jgi:hypothetical protein